MDWIACVGLDWGEAKHAYTIRSADGGKRSGTFGSSAEEVHGWVRALRETYPCGTIAVALEQGRGSLIYALAAYEFLTLVPINPRASKAYRESLRLSGASSDPLDAELICDFAMKHSSELRVWQPDDALTRKLRILAETRRSLVDQRTMSTHRLAATLKEYYPQALQWFGGESSTLLLVAVGRWPSLAALAAATVDEIASLLRSARCRKVQTRAAALFEKTRSAVALTTDAAIIETRAMYAQTLVRMIETLQSEISKYDAAIAVAWSAHPDRSIFDSLPGAGPVIAPRLAAAFGTDRSRFQTALEIQCYSGIAPVTESSGKQHWVHARWGYPHFLHQTFHEFAANSIPHSRWAHAYYQQQRAAGARHHQAVRALAFRWIRILFRLWNDQLEYNEERYIESLSKRHSPLALRLAA
jgi:transposase